MWPFGSKKTANEIQGLKDLEAVATSLKSSVIETRDGFLFSWEYSITGIALIGRDVLLTDVAGVILPYTCMLQGFSAVAFYNNGSNRNTIGSNTTSISIENYSTNNNTNPSLSTPANVVDSPSINMPGTAGGLNLDHFGLLFDRPIIRIRFAAGNGLSAFVAGDIIFGELMIKFKRI